MKMLEGTTCQGNWWLLEVIKVKDMHSPLRASRGNQGCRSLDFSPMELIL